METSDTLGNSLNSLNRRSKMLDKLLESYSGYFDIQRTENGECGGRLAATAQYHSREAKYVLTRKAELWGYETHEYVFLFSISMLDKPAWDEIKDYVIREGLLQVRPHKEHMCSYLTALILADHIAPELEKEIKKSKFSKSFKFSFHGSAMLRAAALDMATGKAVCNSHAKELAKHIENKFKEES